MNTRKNTFMVSALVTLLVVSMAAFALAQGPGQGQGRNGKGRGQGQSESGPRMQVEKQVERMAKHLDLSAEQVKSITEIQTSGRTESQGLRKQAMRLRNEKRGEMLKDDPSAKKVLALTAELGDLRTQMQVNRMENRLAVRKVLTPEQRDKMLLSGEGRGNRGNREGREGRGDRKGRGGKNNDCNGSQCSNGSARGN